ncbi:MAG TPA: hypothetical protein VIO11_10510 [Candidatus Methanoperedens sp.]
MNTLCFVKYDAQIRIYKQAKALKNTGRYRLVLICEKCNYDLLKDVFDEIIFYGFLKNKNNNFASRILNYGSNKLFGYSNKNLKKIINNINADIFHTHAEPNDVPRTVMENSKVPVVFDSQDFSGISFGLENLDKKIKEDEKYCFEHASGICHKGPEFEIDYYRQHGYNINAPEIQWMDYCDKDLFVGVKPKKLSMEDGEIHLVHTGTISNDPKYRYKYLIPLGKKLAKQRVHLHIYPSNNYEYRTSKEYLELDRKEKYFHFHDSVAYLKLPEEIAQYDWHSHILEYFVGPMFTPEKQRVSMGNKLFTSLEAGLPMVVSPQLECIRKLVEKYKIGIIVKDEDLNSLKQIIENQNYTDFQSNVLKAREKLSLDNQVPRLEKFYQIWVK